MNTASIEELISMRLYHVTGRTMCKYYIYNKYFVNKLIILSLHQNSYMNNHMVNKK